MKQIKSNITFSIVVVFILTATGSAQTLQKWNPREPLVKTYLPPPHDYVQDLKAAGLWEKFKEEWNNRPPNVERAISPAEGASLTYDKALFILIDFPDAKFDTTKHNLQYYTDLMFSENKLSTGSVKDFLRENSYGQFTFDGLVYGIVHAPHPLAYYDHYNTATGKWENGYGRFPTNVQGLLVDIIPMIDGPVDFKQFDPDGNGIADHIIMIFASDKRTAQADGHLPFLGGAAWELWEDEATGMPWGIATKSGKFVKYFVTLDGGAGMGAFEHELGHNMLGLPDLYDTDYSSAGVGDWSSMAWGIYRTPPVAYDARCKVKTGWVTPIIVDSNWTNVPLPRVEDHRAIYKVWKDGKPGREYYLLENRRRVMTDRGLPGEGLLIWHCDDAVTTGNTKEWYPDKTNQGHYLVALEQADGKFDLERNTNHGDAGDPYPGSMNNRAFDFSTSPNSISYNPNISTDVAVWNISNTGDTMWCNIFVNLNGPPTPPKNLIAESGYLSVDLRWQGNWEDDVIGYNVYRSTRSGVGFVKINTRLIDSLWYRQSGLSPGQRYYYVVTAVDVQGYESAYSSEVTVLPISLDRRLLVVNETHFTGTAFPTNDKPLAFYSNVFSGIEHDMWNVDTLGLPSMETLGKYATLLWLADDYTDQKISQGISLLDHYLEIGGNLILVGWRSMRGLKNTFYPITFTENEFAYKRLHIAKVNLQYEADFVGAHGVFGYPDIHVDSVKVTLPNSNGKMRYIETFSPVNAEVIYLFDSAINDTTFEGKACAIRFISHKGGRVLVTGFPLYFLQTSDARTFVLKSLNDITTAVAERVSSEPVGFVLYQNYPNPFNPQTVIEYQISNFMAMHASLVQIRIYDVLGREIKTLVNQKQEAGRYAVVWDGTNEAGAKVASGVYLYHLLVSDFVQTKKMILLR